MKFKLYREFGALNSKPVFDALEIGLKNQNHEIVDRNEDVSVIWSVLWQGRMLGNQKIYQQNLSANKKTMIVEVGNLKRNITWRISLNNVNRNGYFGNQSSLDTNRENILKVFLMPKQKNRRDEILITCQHEKSLQWQGQPSMSDWVNSTILQIRQYSDRKIVVRPHPRSNLIKPITGATILQPKKIDGTYDDYDIDYRYHCVINHNSGPAVQAAVQGVPIICDSSSLASPMSNTIQNIEQLTFPDRKQWFLELLHTEWTLDEITKGIPIQRLFVDYATQ